MVQLYLIAGSVVTLGFVWFWIVRPIAVALWDSYVDWSEARAVPARPRARRAISRRRVRVMSRPRVVRRRAEPVRLTTELAEPLLVRAHQNQVEPDEPGQTEPAREPLQLNRLSRTAEIALLAVQRNEDGSYRHSANAITQFVGGTAADVKRQIAEIRAAPQAEQPKTATRVDRPPRGWPKSA